MATRQKKTPTLRTFILRRFVVITVCVIVIVLALITLEDLVFSGLISMLSHTQGDAPGQLLRLAGIAFSVMLPGRGGLDVNAVEAFQLILLFVLLLALVVAPVVIGAVLFSRMAEKRVLEEQRARDAERAQFYNRRNLMISDMAHDLRTPVMSISGLAQALSDGMVEDEQTQQRYLHSIMAKSEKMAGLVTMLFDFVKLESEGYTLEREQLDLPQLVLREAAAAYTDVEDAGMQLRIEVPEDPISVNADSKQLGRVVANLIANAVRHNSSGTTIVVGLNRRAGVADIIVADDGIIIESDVEKLFEPFTREDAARSGGGSGLGLSIVKTIVDMHGYDISLVQPYGIFTKAFVVTCAIED